MSFGCHLYALMSYLYVLVYYSYVSRMYSYFIRMSLVCTRMSFVCHSYVVLPWTVLDYLKVDDIYQYSVLFGYSKNQLTRFSSFSPRAFMSSVLLSLSKNDVLPFASPLKYIAFVIRNMSHKNILNKIGPSIEPWGTPENLASQEHFFFG